MRWFSLFTVGLISLCSMGFAKVHTAPPNAAVKAASPKFIEVVNIPATDIPLILNKPIPFGVIQVNSPKYFALASDRLTITCLQKGSYQCHLEWLPVLDTVVDPFTMANVIVEFSTNGTSWSRVFYLSTLVNTEGTADFPLITRARGQVRLRYAGSSGRDANLPVYLKAGIQGVQFSITYPY